MMPSALPQTISVGAAMRWMRRLKAAVGDRPDEFAGAGLRPDELRRAPRRARAGSAGTSKKRRAASPSGSANSDALRAASLSRSSSFAPDDRRATDRPDRSAPAGRPRAARRRRIPRPSSAPNEWPTSAGAASFEPVEQFAVIDDEIVPALERVHRIRIAAAGAGKFRREDRMAARQAAQRRRDRAPAPTVRADKPAADRSRQSRPRSRSGPARV